MDQENWAGGGMVEKDTGKDELCLRSKMYQKLVKCMNKTAVRILNDTVIHKQKS